MPSPPPTAFARGIRFSIVTLQTIGRRLPEGAKRLLRPVWLRYMRLARTWIVPWWRLRGYGTIAIGGRRFRFYEAGSPVHAWWAAPARAGDWEPDVISFFGRIIRPGDTIFDIGSYVGPYGLLASRLVGSGGRVFAFEPDPVARALLERNVRANRASNIIVVDVAITEAAGSVTLAADVPGGGGTTTTHVGHGASVRSLPLGTACEELGAVPDVLKVDVEGGEARAFSPTTLSKCSSRPGRSSSKCMRIS